ncbi:Serine/threonine-protein kinase PrkC [Anatilimnocola aggregata]|uniref:Serine/threonine-protein kinase PrkC n=1 Tax=Anatilimnocola aggregata TaxID=2528021 RepID=A0A517YA49_9BACT|nr:serine/threonine-protein kinase [Anatilimnocola aggregata]QDU27094.1 Serine/threonine-protein kinase PrkC [Anatilimnocola aggregata]
MIDNDVTNSQCEACGADSDGERERLAKILDEYLSGLERGEPVGPEELLARHPDVADRLRGYLSGLALFHNAVAAQPSLTSIAITGGVELGAALGDYRLVREIGRGGMGVVYEAVQISLGRRVAVKLLPFSATINEKQIARFKHEAQAAAQIDHPHIVPVFGVGQAHGIHYFAMQLIGGQSLGELIAEMREEPAGSTPRTAETLDHVMAVARMGVQAAEALDAAHEIGVVHRDVKPSNLLLDERGKVWITDFGVARCKSGACLTETGYVVGSMPYMSPEQALGQPALVDHRTDVYSLGVTLYELATLRHPCEGSAQAETAVEYSRSQWRRPRCWNGSIPIDFENIVLKAMAENRDERYATAGELADDLQRFLDGKPIVARCPSLSSRVEKWARRHQRSVAATIGALALGMIGVVVSLVMIATERAEKDTAYRTATQNSLRAQQNYQRAEAKFRQAREVLDRFGARVNQMLANDLPGVEGMRRELLAEMLPYYREFAREAANDPSLQADLALTYSKIGFLSEQIGSQSDAERAYQDAKAILARLVQTKPANDEHQRSLALCCNNLGQVLQKRGAMAAAEQEMKRAFAIQTQLAEHSSLAAQVQPELATTMCNLGLLFSQAGDKRQAAEQFQTAITIQESIRKITPRDEANLNNLAASYNNLSSLYLPAQSAAAQRWIERSLAIQSALVREYPTRRSYQSDLALSYNNLGTVHSRLNRRSEAELCFRDAITIQERLVAIAPLVTAYRRDLATSFNNLGMAQTSSQSLSAAESSFDKALAIQKDLVEAHPQDLSLLSGLGGIYNNLGMVRQANRQWEAASAAFEQAIAAQRQAYERAPGIARFRDSLSKHYFNQAVVLRALQRPADAAAATLARRDLWPDDTKRLLRIADELTSIGNEFPAGDLRQRYLREAKLTRSTAIRVGGEQRPVARTGPFDVLFQDSAGVEYSRKENQQSFTAARD